MTLFGDVDAVIGACTLLCVFLVIIIVVASWIFDFWFFRAYDRETIWRIIRTRDEQRKIDNERLKMRD